MCDFLIWIASRRPKLLAKEMAKVEYGLANYLTNLANTEGNRYAEQLRFHALQERNHGRMLAAIAGEDDCQRDTGGLAKWKGGGTRVGNWQGNYVQVDGISQRYHFFRKLLGGNKLNDLPLLDRIALMSALEFLSFNFYRKLSDFVDSPFKEVTLQIAGEELGHCDNLSVLVGADKVFFWQIQIYASLPWAILDLWQLISRSWNPATQPTTPQAGSVSTRR